MTLSTRLNRLESGLRATLWQHVDEVAATINRELTIPERRAFCLVARRAQALQATGVACPVFPGERDVTADGDTVRLPQGEVLCTADEWALYRPVAKRAAELWTERGGPDIGLSA